MQLCLFTHATPEFLSSAPQEGVSTQPCFFMFTDIVHFLCLGHRATIILLVLLLWLWETRHPTPQMYRLSSLSLPTACLSCQSGLRNANAEKSVRVGVSGSVWKPCWPWLHPFTSSNALWQTSHRHTTVWLHRRKRVCALAALSRALRGPLRFTHTHIYALFVAPPPHQESQISCHGSGNRQHLLGVWSQWWNCLDAEAVMPNPHFERQEMGFAVAACVSLVFFFFSLPTYFPHLLLWHTMALVLNLSQ